jgi:hypothetical protein
VEDNEKMLEKNAKKSCASAVLLNKHRAESHLISEEQGQHHVQGNQFSLGPCLAFVQGQEITFLAPTSPTGLY